MRPWLAIALLLVLLACQLGPRAGTSAPTTRAITPEQTAAASAPTAAPPASGDLLAALRAMGLDRYGAIRYARAETSPDSEWITYHYDPDDVRCIEGGDYYIMARPGTEPDKTVLWLEGGGACWPGQDACTKNASVNAGIAEYGLASQDPINPVGTWNFVYVPYCDGSVHSGDSAADYDGDGQADHWHWGLRSTGAAAALVKELFPDSRKLLVAGCSAGGYGTFVGAPSLRLQFPEAQLYVLNEAGPGLFNPAQPETWALVRQTWNLESLLPADCPRCREQLIYIYPWLLARDPRLKVGMFSAYRDAVIGEQYLEMRPADFEALLLETTGSIRAEFPETFKRYFIKGRAHCVPDYFYAVGGVSVKDWIEALVNDRDAWEDVLE